jgi:hypothetical protein
MASAGVPAKFVQKTRFVGLPESAVFSAYIPAPPVKETVPPSLATVYAVVVAPKPMPDAFG